MPEDNFAVRIFILFLIGMCVLAVILWFFDFTMNDFYTAIEISLKIK